MPAAWLSAITCWYELWPNVPIKPVSTRSRCCQLRGRGRDKQLIQQWNVYLAEGNAHFGEVMKLSASSIGGQVGVVANQNLGVVRGDTFDVSEPGIAPLWGKPAPPTRFDWDRKNYRLFLGGADHTTAILLIHENRCSPERQLRLRRAQAAIDQVLRLTQPGELVIAGLVSFNAKQHLGERRTVIHGKNEEGIVGLRSPASRCRQWLILVGVRIPSHYARCPADHA